MIGWIEPVTFDRLDVPFVVLVLGGGNLAAFDRSQDRGLFDAACRRQNVVVKNAAAMVNDWLCSLR
jgi:hypothetical protein